MTLLLLSISISLKAATVAVTFTSATPGPPTVCNDDWTENGIPLQIVSEPNGGCSFQYGGGDLWLFPARLTADLSGLGFINSIEFDITDYCGIGCTSGEILDGTTTVSSFSNGTSNNMETIVFTNTGNANITDLFIQSFEGVIHEIRIDYDGSPPPVIQCCVNIPFDLIPPESPTSCNDQWEESYVPQQVVSGTFGCNFDYSGGVMWLYGANLVVDLKDFYAITRIEIDVNDQCGIGCTTAEVMENGISVGSFSNADIGPTTFTFLNTNQDIVDTVIIGSEQGYVSEIRIYSKMTNCPGVLTMSGGALPSGIYSACEELISSNEVVGMTDFISQVDINLLVGFLASEGVDFIAYIDPDYCTPPAFAFDNPSGMELMEPSEKRFNILENPASQNFGLEFDLKEPQQIFLTFHNAQGQYLLSLIDGQLMDKGLHRFQYNISQYPSGIYYVTLWENGNPTTQKISIVNF